MKIIRNVILLSVCLVLFGCRIVSTDIRLYDSNKIRAIKSWQVELSYLRIEEKKVVEKGELSKRTVTHFGEKPRNLRLLDDLVFYLKGDHLIDVSKNQNIPSGYIRIHPLNYYWPEGTYFESLSISLYDHGDNIIAQIKIRNGDRLALAKDDEGFAEYTASKLAEILKNKS